MPGLGAGLLRVFIFFFTRIRCVCRGSSALRPEEAPCPAPGSAGSSSRFPQRPGPRRQPRSSGRHEYYYISNYYCSIQYVVCYANIWDTNMKVLRVSYQRIFKTTYSITLSFVLGYSHFIVIGEFLLSQV